MNQKTRFIIYGVVAVFLAVNYFIKESDKVPVLPVIGTVPDFSFTDSHGEIITKANMAGEVGGGGFFFSMCKMCWAVLGGDMEYVFLRFL